jgi:hypothetical protein
MCHLPIFAGAVLEFLNNLCMGARNRVGIGLSYRPTRLNITQPGGFGSSESILGLLKSLKIRALVFKTFKEPAGIDSKDSILPANVAWRAGTTKPIPTKFLAPIDCSEILTLYFPLIGCRKNPSRWIVYIL